MAAKSHGDSGFIWLAGAGVVGLALYNHFQTQINAGLTDITGLFTATPATAAPTVLNVSCAAGYVSDGYGNCIPIPPATATCPAGYTSDGAGNCTATAVPVLQPATPVVPPPSPPASNLCPPGYTSNGAGGCVLLPPTPAPSTPEPGGLATPPPTPPASPSVPILQPSTPVVPPAVSADQALLNTEYQSVLNRAPDASGDAYWLSVIAQQRAAGVPEAQIQANIAAAFTSSAEAAADQASGG